MKPFKEFQNSEKTNEIRDLARENESEKIIFKYYLFSVFEKRKIIYSKNLFSAKREEILKIIISFRFPRRDFLKYISFR